MTKEQKQTVYAITYQMVSTQGLHATAKFINALPDAFHEESTDLTLGMSLIGLFHYTEVCPDDQDLDLFGQVQKATDCLWAAKAIVRRTPEIREFMGNKPGAVARLCRKARGHMELHALIN